MTFKVHLDGFNKLPLLTGKTEKSPRKGFFYFNDDGDLSALRYENWKACSWSSEAEETLSVWIEPFNKLRGAADFRSPPRPV